LRLRALTYEHTRCKCARAGGPFYGTGYYGGGGDGTHLGFGANKPRFKAGLLRERLTVASGKVPLSATNAVFSRYYRSGTQVVLALSYLNPGALFRSSFVSSSVSHH
jgi:hypothetical protein